MKKISLILLIPFGSLIGISILFNVYNDYLKMAASQYNYDYYKCQLKNVQFWSFKNVQYWPHQYLL